MAGKANGETKAKGRRKRRATVDAIGRVIWNADAMDKLDELTGLVRDGWENLLTGLGNAQRDKRVSSIFKGSNRITHQRELLEELYHGDDLVSTIIDLPAGEMTREWIDLMVQEDEDGDAETDTAALIMQELDELGAQEAVATAIAWGRLYGGGLILLGVVDGQEPDQPLDFDRIESLDHLTVLDRFDVEVNTLYADPLEDKFGLPETYRLIATAETQGAQGTGEVVAPFNQIVHETRTIRFDGGRTSRKKRRENRGWADSVLVRVFDIVRDFQGASNGIMHLLQDFSQAVFKIKDLANALKADKDALVLKRLMMLDMARSMVRAVPLDAEAEEFERQGAAVTGLADLYDRMMMRLSAATRIPVTLLFGRSPAGMNATGESDIRLFYDHIAAQQEVMLRPRIEYLLSVLLNAKQGPTGGTEPESWSFDFNPLYQESAKEQAETREWVAKADKIYIETGVVTPDEVANSRYGGDAYSPETQLDMEQRAAVEADAQRLRIIGPPIGDGKDDAPHYRLQSDPNRREQVCMRCNFADGTRCQRFDFSFDSGHTCDDWQERNELIQLDQRRRRRRRSLKRAGTEKRRRGRNY